MAIAGFIFDLDGVLTDTAEYHYRAWKRLADEEGLPFDRADNEALRGVDRRASLLLILKGRPLPEAQLQAWLERKNGYYLESIRSIGPGDMLPGARALLDEIGASGRKRALGSASKNARQVLAGLGIVDLFEAVADGYSVERQKPAPDLFLHAAGLLGLSPAQCVVVEDSAAGIQAAQAGGFRSLGLGPAERVGQAGLVLPSLEGIRLASLLQGLDG